MPQHKFPKRIRLLLDRWRGHRVVHFQGERMRVMPQDEWFWDEFEKGLWEPETIHVLREFVQPQSRYCDIGAWVGPTVLVAHALGAKVWCFEPDPIAYERLLGNLRLNGLLDVRSLPIALAAADGTRDMGALIGSLGKSATSLLGASRMQTVEVNALSWVSAVAKLQLPVFDVIKIDIEGGEHELLPAMLDYLAKHKPVLVLATHWDFLDNRARGELQGALRALAPIYRRSEALTSSGRRPVDLFGASVLAENSLFLLREK